MSPNTAKLFIRNTLRKKAFNVLLRQVLRPFSSILPEAVTNHIPVIGLISLRLSRSKKLYLESDVNDSITSKVYWKGIFGYEGATVRLFMESLGASKTVFDIGANTGLYALLAAADNPKRNVYAFEPVPQIFDRLKRNADLNELKNLHAYQYAVTDHDGRVEFYLSPGAVPLESSMLKGFRDNTSPTVVPALTIDSFVMRNNIKRVDLLKMDTEATEHLVLEGAKAVLQRDEPMIICEVLWGRTERFLNALLDNTNYQFFLITDDGLVKKERIEGDNTYKFTNYLFSPEEKVRGLSDNLKIKLN